MQRTRYGMSTTVHSMRAVIRRCNHRLSKPSALQSYASHHLQRSLSYLSHRPTHSHRSSTNLTTAPLAYSSTSVHSSHPVRRAHFNATLGLSDDQLAYQQTALDFATTELAPYAAEWDATSHFPVPTLRKAAQLGFAAVYVRDDVGGSGLSRKDGAIIFESLATADVSSAAYLTIHNMCGWMIDAFGSDEQRQRYLPSVVSMERLCSYCLTEPSAGSDAASLRTSARLSADGSSYTLSGEKVFISGAGTSDLYIVMARTGKAEDGGRGVTAFIVEKDTPGLSFGKKEDKLGWRSQPTRSVVLDGVVVGKQQVLGGVGEGFKIAMRGLDGGRINIGATALGGAITCYNYAIDYVKQRQQFGRPIAELQNTQFALAGMLTKLTTARLLLHRAAELLDERHSEAAVHCAMAKRYATDVSFDVCNGCLQLLGGYGYLRDYPIERFVRDVRVHQILEGTNEIMQVITSRHILKD